MVIVLWRNQFVEMESAKVCYIKAGEKDNVFVGWMRFYILRNGYLGCVKDDECPGNKPDCRSGVCIKGLFYPMSKEGGEGSLPTYIIMLT